MTVYEYGSKDSGMVLIQPVDDHDLAVMESEIRAIKESAGDSFCLKAIKVNSWNHDLSPWKAPAVFGNEDFGDGAENMLREILKLTEDRSRTYCIGGYSLAGLFSLWAAYQTDIFSGVAAASPSLWFPGFMDYAGKHEIKTGTIYLSLGDREEKTRNKIMSTVGDCTRELYDQYLKKGLNCRLEWNSGNHFKEPDLRTAKAFSWAMRK